MVEDVGRLWTRGRGPSWCGVEREEAGLHKPGGKGTRSHPAVGKVPLARDRSCPKGEERRPTPLSHVSVTGNPSPVDYFLQGSERIQSHRSHSGNLRLGRSTWGSQTPGLELHLLEVSFAGFSLTQCGLAEHRLQARCLLGPEPPVGSKVPTLLKLGGKDGPLKKKGKYKI